MFADYQRLLQQNHNFRHLWLGAVISQFGDWFNLIASAALIASLTDAGTAISYLFLARFLPLFFFSPIAGVLADRFDRRRLLILSDLLRGVTVLGFLFIRSADQVWLFYALTITQFALSALFTPARSAVMAAVVADKDLVTANALDSITWSANLALGALAGGVIAGLFGLETAFALDALTFVLSAAVLGRIQLPAGLIADSPQPADGALPLPQSGPYWPRGRRRRGLLNAATSFFEGFTYLLGVRFLLLISLVKAAGSLVYGAINVLEVTFAADVFPIGESSSTALGFIYAASGLGTGLGPIIIQHYLGDSIPRLRQGITLAFLLLTAGIGISSVAPTFSLFLLGTLIRTVGSGTAWVFTAALLQSLVPDRVRGRVFAFEFALLTLTQSISILWAGQAQDSLGWDVRQVSLSLTGLSVLVTILWLLLARRTASPAPAEAA